MKLAVKMRILTVVALLCGVLAGTPAAARDVRFPETGNPAFTAQVPDDWTTREDANGNMLLGAADHLSAFSLSIIYDPGTLDEMAAQAMKVAHADPPKRGAAVTLSGYSGFTYYTRMTNASGVHMTVKMIAVKLDNTHVATCTMLISNVITPASLAVSNAVLHGMALTAHP